MKERNAPIWVKIFVPLHMAAVLIWALPHPPEAVANGRIKPKGSDWLLLQNARQLKTLAPVQAYLFTTGFWQYWDMFAPNPVQRDMWCDATVVFHDGSEKRFLYPRMYELSIPEKYVKERFRKFDERAGEPKHSYFWPPFGQWIALQMYSDPLNPPTKVRLRRHWLRVAPPGKPQPSEYKVDDYFTYVVDQEKLRSDKASLL
jgi:hypothetical protein